MDSGVRLSYFPLLYHTIYNKINVKLYIPGIYKLLNIRVIGNNSFYIYLIQEKIYMCENLQVYRQRERKKEREREAYLWIGKVIR